MKNDYKPFNLPSLFDENGNARLVTVYHGTDTLMLPDILMNGFPVVENGNYFGQQVFLDRFFVPEKLTPEVIKVLEGLLPKLNLQRTVGGVERSKALSLKFNQI